MNSAEKVETLLQGWVSDGKSKAEIVWLLAEACMGYPYVFGAVGEKCTPAVRKKYYNNYLNRNPDEAKQIKKKCRVLNGTAESCSGCPYYPGSPVRCFDCRGFTRWVLGRVGISLQGGGATSQWNNPLNWDYQGTIDQYTGGVAIFFQRSTTKANTMAHTGILIGGGQIIHCSGTVKKEALYKKITHFAIPKGLAGEAPMPTPSTTKPTLRKGSKGEYVTLLQTQLINRGYSLPRFGADGSFGGETDTAVREFQMDNGLPADGVVGPKTWEALESSEPIKYYTVTIPHLAKHHAKALVANYDGATMSEEGG